MALKDWKKTFDKRTGKTGMIMFEKGNSFPKEHIITIIKQHSGEIDVRIDGGKNLETPNYTSMKYSQALKFAKLYMRKH